MNDDLEELEGLGGVEPPAPGVLDAAREVLWSAVAAEMLAPAPPDAAPAGRAHAGGERAAGQIAEEPAGEPHRADPGSP